MPSPTERIVQNKLLTAVARASMNLSAPLLTAVLATAGWYFTGQNDALAAVDGRVDHVIVVLNSQGQGIALLKQAGASDQVRRDREQSEIKTELASLRAAVSQLSNVVAAQTAVLEGLRRTER